MSMGIGQSISQSVGEESLCTSFTANSCLSLVTYRRRLNRMESQDDHHQPLEGLKDDNSLRRWALMEMCCNLH